MHINTLIIDHLSCRTNNECIWCYLNWIQSNVVEHKTQQSKTIFVFSEDDNQRPRSRSVQCSPCLSPPLSVSGLEYDTERRSSSSETHHDRALNRCELIFVFCLLRRHVLDRFYKIQHLSFRFSHH